MLLEELAQHQRRARHYRHDGSLVDDAGVQGRRLEEEDKIARISQLVEVVQRLNEIQHLDGEQVGVLTLEHVAECWRKKRSSLARVDAPDHPVFVVMLFLVG